MLTTPTTPGLSGRRAVSGRRRSSGSARSSGFTLVEGLLAGMILAISAVAIGSAVTAAMRSLEQSGDYQRAAALLDRTLTKIDLLGPDRVGLEVDSTGRFSGDDSRFAYSIEITPVTGTYLYEVRVEVTWGEGADRGSAVAHTYLNDQPSSHNRAVRWEDL